MVLAISTISEQVQKVSGWCSRSSRRTSHREIARELSAGEEEGTVLVEGEAGSTSSRYVAAPALLSLSLLGLATWFLTTRYFGASPSRVRPADEVDEWGVGGGWKQQQVKGIIQQHGMYGVSLGGWLCLEDWLNSGRHGSEVSTVSPPGQGQCLPPLLKHVPNWSSEGLLVKELMDSYGKDYAIKAISAYRASFVSEKDLDEIAANGLKWVRLPLSWVTFADALAKIYPATYGQHDPMNDMVIVPDPFWKEHAFFVTVPRKILLDFIHKAQKRGLKVLLDIHNSPGGSQRGTYNGIWPLEPMFWKAKTNLSPRVPLTKLGLLIAEEMIHWIEGLEPELRSAIMGVCLMNEPGHMNALSHPFADEGHILSWLAIAADIYRKSTLPRQNIKLYMSLIHTAFKNEAQMAIPWYHRTFSLEERKTWLVAELHYYQAWNGDCDGSTKWGASSYQCGEARSKGIAAGCAYGAASSFRQQWGPETQIAVNEFSLATFSEIDFACKDREFLVYLLSVQLGAFQKEGFQTSFWTWKTSLAYDFEPGWSLKWLLGLEVKDSKMWCGSTVTT